MSTVKAGLVEKPEDCRLGHYRGVLVFIVITWAGFWGLDGVFHGSGTCHNVPRFVSGLCWLSHFYGACAEYTG